MQIGNAITEKMVLDVILQARDRGLFHAITDCGAGGFSSAVGEMGAELGAEVELERAPLKYQGLSYTEIWISEAQERMVLAVPAEQWPALEELCRREGVEATDLGRFVDTGRLDLALSTASGRRPVDGVPARRPAGRRPRGSLDAAARAAARPRPTDAISRPTCSPLLAALGRLQQGVDRPPVRPRGPGADRHQAAGRRARRRPRRRGVVLPVRGSTRGLAVGCGINPRYGRLDPYAMAGCVIDEAIRNCVAVGADPTRIALLDNFCWGNTERPETLGSLVPRRAGLPRRRPGLWHAVHLRQGQPQQRIHARGTEPGHPADPPDQRPGPGARRPQVRDDGPQGAGQRARARGHDTGRAGRVALGRLHAQAGGRVPRVDPAMGRACFRALHAAIRRGLVRSCHDLSEGGLAVALAEMAFAGGLGARVALRRSPASPTRSPTSPCFSRSHPPASCWRCARNVSKSWRASWAALPFGRLGEVTRGTGPEGGASPRLTVLGLDDSPVIDARLSELKAAWQRPLNWT